MNNRAWTKTSTAAKNLDAALRAAGHTCNRTRSNARYFTTDATLEQLAAVAQSIGVAITLPRPPMTAEEQAESLRRHDAQVAFLKNLIANR